MFDHYIAKKISNEILINLKNKRIQKIWAIDKNSFTMKFKSTQFLFISCDSNKSYISIKDNRTTNNFPNSTFLLSLRKYLEGAKLINITTLNDDRIIEFELIGLTNVLERTTYYLIVEIMGRHSNIIILSNERKIIASLKRTPFESESENHIRVGLPYIGVSSNKNSPISSLDSINNIFKYKGFYRKLIYLLPENIKSLNVGEIDNFIRSSSSPRIYLDKNGNFIDYHHIENEMESINFNSYSNMINTFYENSLKDNSFKNNYISKIKTRIKSLERKDIALSKDYSKTNKIKDFQVKGELIYSAIYSLPKRAEKITVYDYYKNKDIEINLNSKLTVLENAKIFFNRAAKLERSKLEIIKQKNIIKSQLLELNQFLYDLELLDNKNDLYDLLENYKNLNIFKTNKIKKNNSLDKYRLEYIYNDIRFIVGRNSKENDRIRRECKNKDYIWFHAKNLPGSHVIAYITMENIKNDELIFGAKLAAYYSKSKGISSTTVDYTLLKHVKNIKGAKAGFVIYSNEISINISVKLQEIISYKI